MKSVRHQWLVVVGLLLAVPSLASAGFIVTDVYGTDDNVVTNVDVDDATQTVTIDEDYGESWVALRSPYPGGKVAVNENGDFFDLKIEFDQAALDAGPVWTFDFNVTNTGFWRWIGYGFEFWNDSFSSRITDVVDDGLLLSYSQDVGFQHEIVVGWGVPDQSVLLFFMSDPEPERHVKGATHTYSLELDLSKINSGAPGAFGLRQIAVIPEPSAAVLGLLGLPLLRRRRR